MAEPTSTTGAGLAAMMIATLGPAAGEYATIVFAALAGSLWPLSSAGGLTRETGALMLLRLVLTSASLAGVAAWVVTQHWSIPATTALAPVAFGIAALGDAWRGVFRAVAKRLSSLISGKP